jgi:hypothetical protein
MKRDIEYIIKRSLDRVATKRPQLNFDSESAREHIASVIVGDILDCSVGIETYNEDQLELFSNITEDEHK